MRMAIDTDPGIDDALALLVAFACPEVNVHVITTVAGNVPVDTATRNLFRLLALRPPASMPRVAAGAAAPLHWPLETATYYHGDDGLGDTDGWPTVDRPGAPDTAVDVLLESVRHHRGELTLLALGPLTNVARAVVRDADAMRSLERIVVMGGAVDVPGNVTPTAEFNLHVDPHAAAVVFEAGLALDLVPLDATRQVVLERERFLAAAARSRDPAVERIVRFTERGFRGDATVGRGGMVLHDPLAFGAALDAGLVDWELERLVIAADGATRRAAGPTNCRVARRVDAPRFLGLFLERLLGPEATSGRVSL